MNNFVDENYKKSFKVTKKMYGGANAREIKKLQKLANAVVAKEQLYASMSDGELSGQTQVLKQRLANGESLDNLLVDAFAVCREASWRVLKQKHYYVQILGGIALHQGRICQMATGEGKTLTETLPAYLNALAGSGVHIVTVNEYLACRDMEWMGKVFRFLGLTVGVTLAYHDIKSHELIKQKKKDAYLCDITYGTSSEFGFDYLRDNMAKEKEDCVQRGLSFVIVDEVDSILIDEARTPLIISGPSGKSGSMYVSANKFAATLKNSTNVDDEGNVLEDSQEETSEEQEEVVADEIDLEKVKEELNSTDLLFDNSDSTQDFEDVEETFGTDKHAKKPNGDYVVDQKEKTVRLTDKGIAKAEKFFKLKNLSDPENSEYNHYINNALRAHAIMHRDEDYIVERGQVIIVDTFTGRKMEGRRFSKGLHQAIEAKEYVEIKEEDKTWATITLQNYFRLYRKMSGMTGTAKTEEQEFNTIYNIDVVAIPTNMPLIREDLPDMLYRTRQAKLNAIVQEVEKRHEKGQPLLIGTATVQKSEELEKLLTSHKIKARLLNAKNHEKEAEIIAQAGRFGSVTIATNMAGRGTDIMLGGNCEFLAKHEMQQLGYTEEEIDIATSFNKGDEETEKLQQEYARLVEKHKAATAEDRKKVLEAGGLCVIGTERHDSRRIDDQLRGRSGRQGDVGTSMFFVSTEDDMVRIFSKDILQRAMVFLNAPDDIPIQSKLLSKAIESSQRKVEGLHFSARKNVLQYDDVNNQQRKVIYSERNKVLNGEDIHEDIVKMAGEYARIALENACNGEENVHKWNLRNVNTKLYKEYFPAPAIFTQENVKSIDDVYTVLKQYCKAVFQLDAKYDDAQKSPFYGFREHILRIYNKRLADVAKSKGQKKYAPVKEYSDDLLDDYIDIVVGYFRKDNSKYTDEWNLDEANGYFTERFPKMPLVTEENATSARDVCNMLTEIFNDLLQQKASVKAQSDGLGIVNDISGISFKEIEPFVLLSVIDHLWQDYLDALDDLRQGIGLQAIGQHDPLQVYKREAYNMFQKLNDEIKVTTVKNLFFYEKYMKLNYVLYRAGKQGRKKEEPIVVKKKVVEETEEAKRKRERDERNALKRQQRKEAKNKK